MNRLHLIPGMTVLGVALLAVSAGRSDDCEPSKAPPGPPGFGVGIRADLLRRDLAQSFRREFPVYERAAEGEFSGLMQVAARAYLDPFPSTGQAGVNVIVYGNALSNSIRSAESVSAFTQERSSFTISLELLLNEKGICLGGVGVYAPIRSNLLGIRSSLKGPGKDIVESIGESRFDMGRKRDDKKITAGAEQKMRQSIYQQARKELPRINKRYQEDFIKPLTDAGITPDQLKFSSDEAAVWMTARLKDLRLPEPPHPPNRSAVVQLHPDMFNALANRTLAGKTYNEAEMEKFSDRLSRYFDLPARPKKEEEPLAITMAKKDPLTLNIDGDKLIFTMRGESYKVGDALYQGMNVTARYKIDRKREELHLMRDEDLEVLPPDFKPGDQLGARQQTLRIILRRRLGRLLPPDIALRDIALDTIELQEGLSISGAFRIDVIDTDKGWLSLGLGFKPKKDASQVK